MAVNVRAERTQCLLDELKALGREVCEREGTRMEGVEHLGGFMDSVYEGVGYKYSHISLTISGTGMYKEYKIVDLMWPTGAVCGLEKAIENAKRRVYWRKLSDSENNLYFKKKIESGDPKQANIWDLQKQVEDHPGTRSLILNLLLSQYLT